MEPVKHHQTLYQLSRLRYTSSFNLLTKFLTSILFISLILSCSSSLLPFILNYYMQFLSCNYIKNYMFLLCNGILVFIVKNSGLFGNSHDESSFVGDVNVMNVNNINQKKVGESSDVKEAVVAEEKAIGEEEDPASLIGKGEVVEQGNGSAYPDEDGEEEEKEEEEEEEEEEEAIELPSAEELNKKCDDFIRRMKEGIKLEAQQLVVVR